MVEGDGRRATRRQVLVGAGLAAAALGLSGCGGSKPAAGVSGRPVLWKKTFKVPIRTPLGQTTLVVAGDRLYATHEGSLLAYTAATGAALWTSGEGTLTTFDPLAPLVAGNTLLLLNEYTVTTGILHAIDTASGAPRWQYGKDADAPFRAWPATAGGIVCYSGVGNYAALDLPTGKVLWSHQHTVLGEALPFGAPAMTADTVYLPDEGGTLAALDARTGTQRWIAAGSDKYLRPARLTLIGGLLIGAKGQQASAFDPATGALRWSTSTNGFTVDFSSPQSAGDTVVWTGDTSAGGSEHAVVALGLADGAHRWTFHPEGAVGKGLAVAGGTVYVPSVGALHALDLATGASRWTLRAPGATFSVPAVGNGLVHVFALAPDGTYIEDVLYTVAA